MSVMLNLSKHAFPQSTQLKSIDPAFLITQNLCLLLGNITFQTYGMGTDPSSYGNEMLKTAFFCSSQFTTTFHLLL